jgi:hypothetical protein
VEPGRMRRGEPRGTKIPLDTVWQGTVLSASIHQFGRGLSDCHCERSEAISEAQTMGSASSLHSSQ